MPEAYLPPIFHYDQVDSTNDEALRVVEITPPPYFITAARQTSGRGRMGRTWHSPDGNLYCTAVFNATVPLAQLPVFTLYSALKICEAMTAYTNVPLWLKWPNDLWVGGLKCCGLLAESPVVPPVGRLLLLGVGFNVNTTDFPAEIAATATSLKKEANKEWPLDNVKTVLCGAIAEAYGLFTKGDYKNELQALWKKYDRLTGTEIKFEEQKKVHQGTVIGIGPDGALWVKTKVRVHELRSGEVTLSKFLR